MKIKSQGWGDFLKEDWLKILKPLISENSIFLEVGSFEGDSACWFVENLKPKSLTCVDIFTSVIDYPDIGKQNVKDIFDLNTQEHKEITSIKGDSKDVLKLLRKEYFDFIYIDGSHKGSDVLCDAILADELLKPGGYMLFDDYYWGDETHEDYRYNDPVNNPKYAIDSFKLLYSNRYSQIEKIKNWQILLRKN